MPTLAFKEWSVIVAALGAGEQLLILRKGGIAEGRGGFQLKSDRFWLYPTHFHAQREKTQPAAAKWFSAPEPVSESTLRLRYFAQIERGVFLTDWAKVEALSPYHLWTPETVRERFEWSKPPGIYALLVRVHATEQAIELPVTPEMAGCKSWIDVPVEFGAAASAPVLSDAEFMKRAGEIPL